MLLICSFVFFLVGSTYAALPLHPKMIPCARTDPKFNACALKSANHILRALKDGDRAYKIPNFNPLEITEIKTVSGQKNAGFTLTMTNVKVHHISDTVLDDVNIDFEKKRISIRGIFPYLEILGKYEIQGRILVLPITGKGDTNITLVNSKLMFDMDYTLEPVGGKLHLKFQNSKFSLEPKRTHVYFTNLFGGDKFLGKQMNEFIDENWWDVYQEIAPPLIEAFDAVVNSLFNAIAKSMTFDTLFPETLS